MEFTKSFKNSSADNEGNRDENETGQIFPCLQ